MQKKIKSLILAGLIFIGGFNLVGCTKASDDEKVKVTLILDEGGVNDQSFNQSAWEGALEAKEQYGVEINYIEAKQESDYATNIDMAIDQDADLVIGVGFKLTDTIEEAAKTYPESKFAIIDGTYEDIPENIRPILFNEEQAGYCAGLVAANMTKTNVIGFVGGMEIPSVTNFLIGFEKAIKEENKDIKVLSQYANSFSDASKGRVIAEQMINEKADIIFTAGGGVNSGVFEVTKEKGLYAIGVDMPSNYISPETIVTSALKNVGTGVELTVKDLVEGNFKGGEAKVFDLTNGGVGYEKTDLIPKDLVEYIDNKLNGIGK